MAARRREKSDELGFVTGPEEGLSKKRGYPLSNSDELRPQESLNPFQTGITQKRKLSSENLMEWSHRSMRSQSRILVWREWGRPRTRHGLEDRVRSRSILGVVVGVTLAQGGGGLVRDSACGAQGNARSRNSGPRMWAYEVLRKVNDVGGD